MVWRTKTFRNPVSRVLDFVLQLAEKSILWSGMVLHTRNECENESTKPPIQTHAEVMHRKFLEERKLFFWGEVTDTSCREATEKLLYLETDKPGEEITMYLNSPGGSITAGIAVYDTMKLITSPIRVVVMGIAASMGSILLCAGKQRLLMPHSRVLIHQPLITGRMMGPAVDIHIQAQEMEKLREELNQILSKASGQPMERIEKDTDRDFYMNAREAIDYGLADAIVEKLNF